MIHVLRYVGGPCHIEPPLCWLFEGPETNFQPYCESLICLAADRTFLKMKDSKVQIWGSDVMAELVRLLEERGFKLIQPSTAEFTQTHLVNDGAKMQGLSGFHIEAIVQHNLLVRHAP
jgi:hypothetical protein